jgi:hypothetical protein
MKAHVICCNDSVKAVVLGDEEKAKEHMEKLAKKCWGNNQYIHHYDDYAEYRKYNIWHITTVNAVLMN